MVQIKLKAESIQKVINWMYETNAMTKLQLINELKQMKNEIEQLEKQKIEEPTSIEQITKNRIEEERIKAELKFKAIEQGKRLPHWIIKEQTITVGTETIPVYKFVYENIAIVEAFKVNIAKDFSKVWLYFDYNEDAINAIRGEKTKRGKTGGIKSAMWTGNSWRINFEHLAELKEAGLKLGGKFTEYQEIVDYMLSLYTNIMSVSNQTEKIGQIML